MHSVELLRAPDEKTLPEIEEKRPPVCEVPPEPLKRPPDDAPLPSLPEVQAAWRASLEAARLWGRVTRPLARRAARAAVRAGFRWGRRAATVW